MMRRWTTRRSGGDGGSRGGGAIVFRVFGNKKVHLRLRCIRYCFSLCGFSHFKRLQLFKTKLGQFLTKGATRKRTRSATLSCIFKLECWMDINEIQRKECRAEDSACRKEREKLFEDE